MKNLKLKSLIFGAILIFSIACNRIQEETRVIKKGETDSLFTISLPAAGCNNCQKVVEGGLSNEKGIKQSILNLNTKEVSIVYDPKVTNPQLIAASVTKLGDQMPCKE